MNRSSLDRLPKLSLRKNNGGLPDFYNNQINLNNVAEENVPNSGEKLRRLDSEGNEINQNGNNDDSREAGFGNNRECFLCKNSANP